MKLVFACLVAGMLSVHAEVLSQVYSMSLKNTPLREVLRNIEKQGDYRFFFSDEVSDLTQPVQVNVTNATINQLLDKVLFAQGLNYQILENNLVVISPYVSVMQGIVITGTVTDSNGQPLPGASVAIKGASQGTITNADGVFTLQVKNEDVTLLFSYIGFISQELLVGNRRTINVNLFEDTRQIDEVVVVGYGVQKQGNLTAAISVIKAQEIQTTSTTSVAQKLQGKVSGLNIRQNVGTPGDYDNNNSINIRGFGEPLFVIDGIQRPAHIFRRLNGADIESISVLKDASAAIYGMNAANGVVIVTTKQGVKGKTNFQFTSNIGFSTPTNMPKMANAWEYLTLRNEANLNWGMGPFIEKEELEKWKAGGPGYESTDWYGSVFDKYSMRQEYNLAADGGTDKVSYYFNVNGAFDDGMLKTNDLYASRLSFVSNITAQLTNRIKVRVNVNILNDWYDSPYYDHLWIFRGVANMLPTKSVYANNNPMYINHLTEGQSPTNPLALISSDLTGYRKRNNNWYNNMVELSYDVPYIDGLTLKATGSYDKRYYMEKNVAKDYAVYSYDVTTDTYMPTKLNDPASIENSYTNQWYMTLRAQADYHKVINNAHNINAALVTEARSAADRHAYIQKYFDFLTNDQIDYATETNARSTGNEWQNRYLSYIGKLNYDYKGRYLIEFSGRYDGSYRYHPDVRWGFFPTVSGGWRISDERFMNTLSSVLSNLKIRASYGKIGQDIGDPFQYIPGFTTGGGWWEFTDGVTTLGVNTPAIVNDRLTWMNSLLTDIGVDVSFFKNKLAFTFDWYQKNRSGLLARRNVSLPNTYGGTFPEENLNKDRVKGIEFSVEHNNTIGDVYYKVLGNFNYARTMNVYVEQGTYTNSYSEYRNNSEGRYQGIIWNYNVIGRFQSEEEILNSPIQAANQGNRYVLPGDFIFEDVNGDNMITESDLRPRFYDSNPKMHYSLTLSASYKGFDASLFFQGSALFSLLISNTTYASMFSQEGNIPAFFMDRWHKEDPYNPDSPWIQGKWPAMRTVENARLMYVDSNIWRRDCSYIRLKNIVFGYTIPRHYVQKLGLTNVRFFFDASNVYTWADSHVKIFDPEKVAGAGNNGWNYPLMKTFNFGVDINF